MHAKLFLLALLLHDPESLASRCSRFQTSMLRRKSMGAPCIGRNTLIPFSAQILLGKPGEARGAALLSHLAIKSDQSLRQNKHNDVGELTSEYDRTPGVDSELAAQEFGTPFRGSSFRLHLAATANLRSMSSI